MKPLIFTTIFTENVKTVDALFQSGRCCNVNMAFVGNFSAKTADFVVEDVATMNPAQFPFVRLTPDSFTHLAMDVRDNSVMYVPKYL